MLVKQKSSVVHVFIISLMCIDSASTLSLCGFPVPPVHFPFLRPQDTKSDSPLEEVTGCHCLSLLIFTSPSLHHFKIPPSSHHHQHFKCNKWTSNAFDPVVTWLRKWKMSVDTDTIEVLRPWYFYPRGVIAKLHFVSIMPVSPGGLDQSVFTVIDNCVARLISMVVAQLVNVQ